MGLQHTSIQQVWRQMAQELPLRLASGKARVLDDIAAMVETAYGKSSCPMRPPVPIAPRRSPAQLHRRQTLIRVRHAKRGCSEEEITLGEFYGRCEPYFSANGRIIDQEYQERLPEGMIRCYLVHDRVVGFGHQAINALFPRPWAHLQRKHPCPGLVCTIRRPCRNSKPLNSSWSRSGCRQCSDCSK